MTASEMPQQDRRYLINLGPDLLPLRSWSGIRRGPVYGVRLTEEQFTKLLEDEES